MRSSLTDRVHGGAHKKGISITKDHEQGLAEMDKLSEFAPLHVRCSAFHISIERL